MKTNDQLEPTAFVIFGGAGDLTWRKLVPALFDLSQDRSLPEQFSIIVVAVGRSSGQIGSWQPRSAAGKNKITF